MEAVAAVVVEVWRRWQGTLTAQRDMIWPVSQVSSTSSAVGSCCWSRDKSSSIDARREACFFDTLATAAAWASSPFTSRTFALRLCAFNPSARVDATRTTLGSKPTTPASARSRVCDAGDTSSTGFAAPSPRFPRLSRRARRITRERYCFPVAGPAEGGAGMRAVWWLWLCV